METKLTRLIYDHSPFVLRNLFASIYGWKKNRLRFTGDHERWARFFEEAHGWSESELRNYQDEKLHAMAREAYEHVPYWNETFKSLGLTPDDLRTVDDLPKLPPLEKRTVAEQGRRMLNDRDDLSSFQWHPTSGSTGTPLNIPTHPSIIQMEWAFLWTRYRPGVSRSDRYASFTGLELIPPGRNRPPYWIDNWASHQRMFSIFHLNERTLPDYMRALHQWQPRYLSGYPSAVYMLACLMEKHGLSLTLAPVMFFSASEELQPHYADKIREVFGCGTHNHYGLAELAGAITQYDCGHMHYDMDYAILEFLPVAEEEDGVLAEIVATNMHDRHWPLFRYRTGDLAVIGADDVCRQGTPGRIVRRLQGRTGHYFELPDGARITNISVIAKKCHNIRQMQVVQERPGAIEVRIVPDDDYNERTRHEIEAQFRRKVGDDLHIDIKRVEAIDRTSSGKYLSIVNRMASPPGGTT
jgi:phenylacetate-CoA ligase